MSLTTNLVSYWPLDEASGNATDAHGSNTLTDNNSVGSGTGKVSGARSFARSSSQTLSHADNAGLSQTGDFTFSAWVKLASDPGEMAILSKGVSSDLNNLDYRLRYDGAGGFGGFDFFVTSDGNYFGKVSVSTGAVGVTTGTWYFLVCWHDGTNSQIGIALNAGTPVTASFSGSVHDSAGEFRLGDLAGFSQYWDGLIDEVGLWSRVLTGTEITTLYNGGAGLAYSSFGGGGGATARPWFLHAAQNVIGGP